MEGGNCQYSHLYVEFDVFRAVNANSPALCDATVHT
jgi:hypothetical protein